jgi:phosphinothricin acetyltransferase
MKQIRLANVKDAAGILNIYAPYIQNTSLTFETEIPELIAFEERIKTYLITWPWLVCEMDNEIAGYAYASRYRERGGYQWCVEVSVYISDKYQRTGIAKALYIALLEILKKQGFRNAYAVINLPNEKSVSFHERLGFNYFATYENVGYKLGKWKKVGWWLKQLNEYSHEPPPPVKFSDLEKGFLPGLFREAMKWLKSEN